MEKSSKIASRAIGKRPFKGKKQAESSHARALSGEPLIGNNDDPLALVCSYYIEGVRKTDGALVRYCRVTEECPQWGKAWDKRIDIIRHIKEKHGITIDIPRKTAGRPKNSERGPLPVGSRSHRQAKTRFKSIETRIKLARQKHHKDLEVAADKRWLFSSLNGKIPYEEWKVHYMKEGMAAWEKGMPERIAKMKAKIAKGYEEMSRRYKGVKGGEEDYEEKQTNDEDKSVDGSADMDGGSEEDDNNNAVTPLKVHKIYESKVHIDISSPSTSMGLSPPAKNTRSFTEKVVYLHSILYGLEVQYDTNLARNIATKKASSRTMTLFVLWLEDTFEKEALSRVWFVDSLWHSFMETAPSERAVRNYYGRVDLFERVFTFFPIVDEDHWTLVVFFNCHVCSISCLPKETSAILFFDSLSLRPLDQYISPIKRVLQHFLAYATHPQLRMELSHPEDCHLQTMEMPTQSNTKDCGFYIMFVMKLLLAGMKNRPLRKAFTKNWFVHKDVEAMKTEFGSWAQESAMDATKSV